MDFDKPPRTVAPVSPANIRNLGERTDPSEEMLVWQPTVGPADTTAPTCPNPMTIHAPRIGTGASLAAQLNWRVLAETDHQQVEIKIGESVISVDREMAALVQLLNEAGIVTGSPSPRNTLWSVRTHPRKVTA